MREKPQFISSKYVISQNGQNVFYSHNTILKQHPILSTGSKKDSNQGDGLRSANVATNAAIFLRRSMRRWVLMSVSICNCLLKFGCRSRIYSRCNNTSTSMTYLYSVVSLFIHLKRVTTLEYHYSYLERGGIK